MGSNAPTALDKTVEGMVTPATSKLLQLGASLTGAGAEAAATYKALTSMTSAITDAADRASRRITELRGDASLPAEYRLVQVNEVRDTAKLLTGKLNAGIHEKARQLEAELSTALLPSPAKEDSRRLLIRQEVVARYGQLQGEQLFTTLAKDLGTRADIDSELLSSYGSAMLGSQGLTEDQVKALRAQAVERHIRATGGTRQQQAARAAMSTFRSLNIVGQLSAFSAAAALRMDSVG